MENNRGKIIKGVGGLYDVLTPAGVVSCRARGIFRYENITPLVGDNVILNGEEMAIDEITERKNMLIRPPMANLDFLFITLAVKKPLPSIATVDKLTTIAEFNKIEPVIIITKADLDSEKAEKISGIYTKSGFKVFISYPGNDKSEILSFIKNTARGKTSAFAGASGVGKSTLLNELFPSLSLVTGDISRKTDRGKHTTRQVELYPLSKLTMDNSCEGFIADTPGFSMLDFVNFDFYSKEDLPYTFREFGKYIGVCKYTKCTHTKEDGCAILEAVRRGEIPHSRHESFLEIYGYLKNKHDWDK